MSPESLERARGLVPDVAPNAGRSASAVKNAPVAASSPVAAKTPALRRNADFAPDFMVIGAMKAGTTTLRNYLAQFAEIGVSRTKETDYFIAEKNFALGRGWYERQFDLSRPLLGEASPNYTKYDIFPGVPERIASIAPKAKLIFIARDPVARFASHYRHSWSHGHMRVRPAALLASANGRHMIECSRYGAQIERYLARFDRQQMLFLDFDDLCEAPQRLCDEVADFLGAARRTVCRELPANTAEQISHVPMVLKRAARTTLVRRIDRFIPKATRTWVRKAWSFRKPETIPDLGAELLDEVADLLRDDARQFRELSGKEFSQWRV